jgi:multidrug efflux pump subunit AcrA (membrane-fusion protein)
VIVATPRTEQPVFAPTGGRIESIGIEPGIVVAPGDALLTLVRDPLPRPTLTLTADILRPAQEQLHGSVLDLRTAAEEVRIASAELERVEQYTRPVEGRELPILPRQRAIDLRYQLSRADKAREQARLELLKHGLTSEQIAEVEGGAALPEFDEATWRRALARNGLWPAEAQRLHDALPESLRRLPWVVATIGELAAMGLVDQTLIDWMSDGDGRLHFLDIGVLLQRGHTVEDLRRLHELNALDAIVRVSAPALDGEWDVREIGAKRGAVVKAGDRLVTLVDPTRLYLRIDPVGSEVAAILAAAESGQPIRGRPLIRGSGPDLEGLRISFVEKSAGNDGTVAFLEVENRVTGTIERGAGRRSRTWSLREGVRYFLEIPVDVWEGVFVLPSGAVTDDGPSKVVFLQDGEAFKAVPVAIAYQDERVVVIRPGPGMALFPGDPVVHAGAFELGLAMKSGGDRPDAHAGHNH